MSDTTPDIDKILLVFGEEYCRNVHKAMRSYYNFDCHLSTAREQIKKLLIEARLDELRAIFEWGYPGSSNTGVSTSKCKAPANSIDDRIAQLEHNNKESK